MNIEKETNKIIDWENHIDLLKNTKTLHPFTLFNCIHYWKHKIKEKEDQIIKHLNK